MLLPRLGGSFFLAAIAGADSQGYTAAIWDLRSGRNTYSAVLDWEDVLPVDIEVSARGGAAWVDPLDGTVTKADRSGEADIGVADLAQEDEVNDPLPTALTLDGDDVSWVQNGERRTYRLDGPARSTG